MSKPTASYRMSKAGKIYLACTWDRPDFGQRKRSLIDAEIKGREVVRSKRERTNEK